MNCHQVLLFRLRYLHLLTIAEVSDCLCKPRWDRWTSSNQLWFSGAWHSSVRVAQYHPKQLPGSLRLLNLAVKGWKDVVKCMPSTLPKHHWLNRQSERTGISSHLYYPLMATCRKLIHLFSKPIRNARPNCRNIVTTYNFFEQPYTPPERSKSIQ